MQIVISQHIQLYIYSRQFRKFRYVLLDGIPVHIVGDTGNYGGTVKLFPIKAALLPGDGGFCRLLLFRLWYLRCLRISPLFAASGAA